MIFRQLHPSVRSNSNTVRYLSSLISKNADSITLKELQERLHSPNVVKDDENRANLIKSISVSSNEQKDALVDELFNEVDRFSLYFKLKDVKFPPQSLLKLIELNSGRVYNAWDLLKNNSIDKDNSLSLRVIEKLLNGEECEKEDFEFSLENLSKVMHLMSLIDIKIIDDSLLNTFITRLDELQLITALELVDIAPEALLKITEENKDLSEYSRLKIFNYIFKKDPSALKHRYLLESFDLIHRLNKDRNSSKLKESHKKAYDGFLGEEYFKPSEDISVYDINEFKSELLAYIDESKLDLEKVPESLPLRLKLIEVLGMYDRSIEKALQKFHCYQSHAKYGLDLIQSKMIQVFCYHAISSDNKHNLKVAETLLTNELTIKTLQALIVTNAYFDIEKSLGLYNDYISVVGRDVNKITQRSPAGLLTESVVLSHLYQHDREFAFLIFEKAVENSIVSNELEVAAIKKLFKVYGVSFNEDDKEKSKAFIRDYILQYITYL